MRNIKIPHKLQTLVTLAFLLLLQSCSKKKEQVIVDYSECYKEQSCDYYFDKLLNSNYFIDAIPKQHIMLMTDYPYELLDGLNQNSHFEMASSNQPKLFFNFNAVEVYKDEKDFQIDDPVENNMQPCLRNDMYYGCDEKWGLEFIHALEVMNYVIPKKASKPLLAVLDSGVDIQHPYLRGQLYQNTIDVVGGYKDDESPGQYEVDDDNDGYQDFQDPEIKSLIRYLEVNKGFSHSKARSVAIYDDDENGYPDDYLGWDFKDNDNLPFPLENNDHGMEMAGIISAKNETENGELNSPIGLAAEQKLLPIRLTSEPHGYPSVWSFLKAVDYGLQHGVKIFNYSGDFRLACRGTACVEKLEISQRQFCYHLIHLLMKNEAVLVAANPENSRLGDEIDTDSLDEVNNKTEWRLLPSACNRFDIIIDHVKVNVNDHMILVSGIKRPSRISMGEDFSFKPIPGLKSNKSIHIAAPGETILSISTKTRIHPHLEKWSYKSSAATAIMTGSIALLMSTEKFEKCTAPQVAKVILDNATICSCFVDFWENGRVLNLLNAYEIPADNEPCEAVLKTANVKPGICPFPNDRKCVFNQQ